MIVSEPSALTTSNVNCGLFILWILGGQIFPTMCPSAIYIGVIRTLFMARGECFDNDERFLTF